MFDRCEIIFNYTLAQRPYQRGAEIAEYCDSATICFSDTFLKEEFLTLADCYSGLEQPVLVDRQTCATREIASIISIIKRRVEKYKKNEPFPYSFASADKRIYQQKYGDDPTEIWALSPSLQALIDSLIEISSLIPSAKEKIFRKVTPRPTQNKNAVALLVKSNKICFLLGADLEETKSPLTGWSVIVNSPNRPKDKSMIFKIPHHGSENGHSHDVWTEMLLKDAIGILTTKIGGRSNIPKPSDIKRLRKYTPNLFCAPEPLPSKKKRDRTVEKTMNEIAKRRIPLNGKMGYIQIRTGLSSEVSVGLKIPAKKL